MGELVGKANVIGLSLNVDYWDYIGWRDTLASPANTKRQEITPRSAATIASIRPQMVINGIATSSDPTARAAAHHRRRNPAAPPAASWTCR